MVGEHCSTQNFLRSLCQQLQTYLQMSISIGPIDGALYKSSSPLFNLGLIPLCSELACWAGILQFYLYLLASKCHLLLECVFVCVWGELMRKQNMQHLSDRGKLMHFYLEIILELGL